MDCQEIINRGSDYLDGQLPPSERRDIETHLGNCADCRLLYEDLRQIVQTAPTLPAHAPSDRLWAALQERLREETPPAGVMRPVAERRWFAFGGLGYGRPLFAAAAMLIVTFSVFFLTWKQGTTTRTQEDIVRAEIREAERHYKKAIESLSQIVAKRKSTWDPQIAQVFETNLQNIDQAITECQEAVRRSPADPEAEMFLLAAYGRKVEFLQEILQIES